MCVQITRDKQHFLTVHFPSDVPLCSSRPQLWMRESTESEFLCRAPVLYMTAVSPVTVHIQQLHLVVFTSLVYIQLESQNTATSDESTAETLLLCLWLPSGYPILLHVSWSDISFDFSNVLVVSDQYFQQFVSPVKLVSNLTQLKCTEIHSGSKILASHF